MEIRVPGAGRSLKGVVDQRARREFRVRAQGARDDPGVAVAEVLAWVGDRLGGYADRLANEAYLGSARRRWRAGRRAGAELGIGIEIDGTPWREVPNLASSGPDDRHYIVRQGSDGVTLVEFGDGVHGQRPSAGSAIGVRYRAGARYSSVLLQQGRVVIDTDMGEAPPVMARGIYRATVVETADPLVQRRLRVQVPNVSGDEAIWASACVPLSGCDQIPGIGDGVWVGFESGDPSRPVWLGRVAGN